MSLLALFQTSAAISAPNWTSYSNVQYGVTAAEKLDLFILNRGVNPIVVFIHGGGWAAGDKTNYAGYYASVAMAGFNVASINYRLADQADPATHWNAQLQDVQLAIRWLRKNAAKLRIDPAHIAAVGDSAGGHLALFLGSLTKPAPGDRSALLAAQSPKVTVVVDRFGPTDLTKPNMYLKLGAFPLFGGKTYAQAPALYRNASPVFVVNRQTAPTCIVQGAIDTIVPASQSTELRDRLSVLGVRNQYISFHGGHEFVGLTPAQKNAIDNQTLQCVTRYLQPHPLNAR